MRTKNYQNMRFFNCSNETDIYENDVIYYKNILLHVAINEYLHKNRYNDCQQADDCWADIPIYK